MQNYARDASNEQGTEPTNDNARVDIRSIKIVKRKPITERDEDLISPEWKPLRVDPRHFPDQPSGGGAVPPTIANVRYLLAANGIEARYNVIKKKTEVFIPGLRGTTDNVGNVTIAHVRSLMALHGIPNGDTRAVVDAIADERPYNPVADWIGSEPWDGRDRLPEFYATLTTTHEYPPSLKEIIMYHWLLGAVAAALIPVGFSARLVLTLQGPQSIGKTRWCMALVPDPALRSSVVKTDHHFEGGNKDHIITAMRYWIVEIGELESSLRKDAERLKGVITRDRDVVRIPYAVADSDWPRRTVFMASANGSDFLNDPTGSTRWGVIPVETVDYEHGIDMQQLYAQLAVDFADGAGWWLEPEQEAEMEAWNERYQATSPVRDAVLTVVDLDGDDTAARRRLTATGVLELAGLERVTTGQAREAAAILRAKFGPPKKSKYGMRWELPLRPKTEKGQMEHSVAPSAGTKSKFD